MTFPQKKFDKSEKNPIYIVEMFWKLFFRDYEFEIKYF